MHLINQLLIVMWMIHIELVLKTTFRNCIFDQYGIDIGVS